MQNGQGRRDTRWFVERMPSKDVLAQVLQGDPVANLLNAAKERAVADTSFDVAARPGAEKDEVKAALKLASAAAKRLADGGDNVELSPDEEAALELFILLVARPALFVQKDRVIDRPENWPEITRDEELFSRITTGVGRIELADRTKVGTGFLVGDRRILTNNHVLCGLFGVELSYWKMNPTHFSELCDENSKRWSDTPASAPLFELRGELGTQTSSIARLTRILGHHGKVDMAVLEIDTSPKGSRILPLMTAEPQSFERRRIYAVGHPTADGRDVWNNRITPDPVFRRVFGADDASLGTKRFSPGLVLGWRDENVFTHDASTLPGSSGSCIVDFEHRRVVGLHFGGRYNEQNYAVSVWKLRDDPVLKQNGVVFG